MKKIVSVILSLLLFSATAFAQSTASYSAAGGGFLHITLSNNASQAKEVVIRLSKEKRENYTNDTTFYIFKQIRLQANTEESLTLAMPRNLPAGAYYLDISSADDVLTIYHNNKENLEGKLSLIEGAKTIADMENAMETITQNIAIDFDVYEQYKPKIIKWMLAFKSSKLNFDSFFDLYYSAEAMAQIEGSSIENTLSILKEYSQTANFDISKLLAADKNVQDGVCRWLADPPTVLSSIDEYISEYLALKTLYFAPTWQKLETLITKDLKEELGIDTGVYDTLENKELEVFVSDSSNVYQSADIDELQIGQLLNVIVSADEKYVGIYANGATYQGVLEEIYDEELVIGGVKYEYVRHNLKLSLELGNIYVYVG